MNPTGIRAIWRRSKVTFLGIGEDDRAPVTPPALDHPAHMTVGRTWGSTYVNGKTTVTYHGEVLSKGSVTLDGHAVPTFVLRTDSTFDGPVPGTRRDDVTFAPDARPPGRLEDRPGHRRRAPTTRSGPSSSSRARSRAPEARRTMGPAPPERGAGPTPRSAPGGDPQRGPHAARRSEGRVAAEGGPDGPVADGPQPDREAEAALVVGRDAGDPLPPAPRREALDLDARLAERRARAAPAGQPRRSAPRRGGPACRRRTFLAPVTQL